MARIASGQAAPAAISGVVIGTDGRPLVDVEVVVIRTSQTTTTQAGGDFHFDSIVPGTYLVTMRLIGYSPVMIKLELRSGITTLITQSLVRAAPILDTVTTVATMPPATSRLRDFERRRANGVGSFLTRDDIERRNPVALSVMLRSVPSLDIIDSLGTPLPVSRRGVTVRRIGGSLRPAPCVMRVMVDGMLQPGGQSIDAIPPLEIAGVEVYAGPATMPRELVTSAEGSYCGLVVIWTRG